MVIRTKTLTDAVAAKVEYPQALPIAGGTDVMVDINFGRARPGVLLDLTRVAELREHEANGHELRVGAGVPFSSIIEGFGDAAPALAQAARTVGSPQIRNRGTIGGNLGTASPAGDALPVLLATDARVEIAAADRTRSVPIGEFFVGPRRSVLRPDELITGVRLPPARGPQQYAKVGPRNAMVIAVCSLALSFDLETRRIGIGLGSVGPTVLPAPAASEFLASVFEEQGQWERPRPLAEPVVGRFGELVAGAARPIDDVRGTAQYRRHAVGVLARRLLARAWTGRELSEQRWAV
jgi:CO/xanthine dehydrogenase FAD-binding subunit